MTQVSWGFSDFFRWDGEPIQTVQDVAETVAYSALRSDGTKLWGVSTNQPDETGRHLIVCYTGNGPNSEKHARLIVEMLKVCRATVKAFDSLFGQCFSNPITNAWGKEVNVTDINLAADAARSVLRELES